MRSLSYMTVLSLLEISVIKMGNRSLDYFPKTVPWKHMMMMMGFAFVC